MFGFMLACWCISPAPGPQDSATADSTPQDTSGQDTAPSDTSPQDTDPQNLDTGDTGDSGLEPLCSEEDTWSGQAILTQDSDKEAFALAFKDSEGCCVEGQVIVFGEAGDTLDCLRSAPSVQYRDAQGSLELPAFQRGAIEVTAGGDTSLKVDSWTEEASLTLDPQQGNIQVYAGALEVLEVLHLGGGWGSATSPNRLHAPLLTQVQSASFAAHFEPQDFAGVSRFDALTLMGEAAAQGIGMPAETLTLNGMREADLLPLCAQDIRSLTLDSMADPSQVPCVLELPLEHLTLSRTDLPVLIGPAEWLDGVIVEIYTPGESFRRFSVSDVAEMSIEIDQADTLYQVAFPDLERGSVFMGTSHKNLVVSLPEMRNASTLQSNYGVFDAPKLTDVDTLYITGTLSDLGALQSAGNLSVRNHEDPGLEHLSSLRTVTGELAITWSPDVEELDALHGLESVGSLTLIQTGASEAEIQALVDAIGEANIGETDFRDNGD